MTSVSFIVFPHANERSEDRNFSHLVTALINLPQVCFAPVFEVSVRLLSH